MGTSRFLRLLPSGKGLWSSRIMVLNIVMRVGAFMCDGVKRNRVKSLVEVKYSQGFLAFFFHFGLRTFC